MTDARRYLAVHGHFYQPPREDPFSGRVPRERGAEPFHDFNERISAECYRPNARLANFERISFDLGPTLAAWLEENDSETYDAIVDQANRHFDAHGETNALAQVHSHVIMPLATSHEKRIQVEWGLADFRHRFSHDAPGMWLAETGADTATLVALADAGVEYTILAPWQAADPIDPTRPYWIELPGGRRITAFFYYGPLSGSVSFDPSVTMNADAFASNELVRHWNDTAAHRDQPGLLLIASDGELYGHHQRFRDKFLAHLLNVSAGNAGFEPITLGRFLRLAPPRESVRLVEQSSWSCHHGVDRWSLGCECTHGDSLWKPTLRQAMRLLATGLDAQFAIMGETVFSDPEAAEREYINVRVGAQTAAAFWSRHALDARKGRARAMTLLESRYHRHVMFASCGWFFDDLDGLEPRYAIGNGLKALLLARKAHGADLLPDYARWLRRSRSARTGRTGLDLLNDCIDRAGVQARRSFGLPAAERERRAS